MADRGYATVYRRELIVGCCFLLLGLLCWQEARALDSLCDTHHKLVAQLEQMNEDAGAIRRLRSAPRVAAERERPNDALIAQIRDAMEAAGISPDGWIGHDPLPAVRIPKSPYKQLSVRVKFEGLSLKELVQFAYQLTLSDSTLSIPSLRLVAPRGRQGETWDADLTISYLIYSPYSDR